MKFGKTHIFLSLIAVLVIYILWQYRQAYHNETDNYYHTILNQARLCGRNIDSRILEFEEEITYTNFIFQEDELFRLKKKARERIIVTNFRRFYSQYQDFISGIYFSNFTETFLLKKSRENYFDIINVPSQLFSNDSLKTGFTKIGNELYYLLPHRNSDGKSIFKIAVKLDIAGLVKNEFSKFYIGQNSYHLLIDDSGKVHYQFYSENALSDTSLVIGSIDDISEEIRNGYEGKMEHNLIVNSTETAEVLSAYYPIKIANKNFGLIFSISKNELLSELNNSFLKLTIAFIIIITLVVTLFLYIIKQKREAFRNLGISENRQRDILDSLPDPIIILDESEIILDHYSREVTLFQQLGNIRPTQYLRDSITDKNVYLQYKTIFNQFTATGKLSTGEIRISESNYLAVTVAPYGKGKSLSIFRDISKVKISELNLKLSHERFVTLINSIDAIIYVADFESYEILLVNDFAKSKFGEVIGHKCFNKLGERSDKICSFCTNKKLIDNCGSPARNVEWEYQDTNTGEWFKVYDRAIQWFDGRLVKFEIAFNITEHKLALEKLRESEEKFRSIYESFLDVYFRTDFGGTINMMSPSCKNYIDYEQEEIIGKNASILYVDPNDRNRFVSKLLQNGTISDFEVNFRKKNGEQIAVSLHSRLIYNEKRQPVAIEGSLRDITEKNRTMQELKEAKIAAEAADKTKSQFLASMSHELRTPLNGILGYAQILMQDSSLDETHKDGIKVIHKSGEHLLKLINDILDLSKIDADRVQLDFAPFNLKEMIDGIIKMILIKTNQKKLELKLNYPGITPEWIMQDEKRIKQILINLLNNAAKFTEQGYIELDVSYNNHFLKFTVTDTGIGIPHNKIDSIFSPFEQLGNHLKKSEGTGLGLSICRKLVKLLGGVLLVESEPGKGSKFWFEIPVEPQKAPAGNYDGSFSENNFRGYNKKILIADDNDLNRLVLKKMLQKKNMIIEEAADGLQAYKKVLEFKPDLIFMDKFMPVMDGLQATKKIKSEFNIPIILISATKYEADETDVKEAGFDAIVLKPASREELYTLLSKFFGDGNLQKVPTETEVVKKLPENHDIEFLLEFVKKRNVSRFIQYVDHLENKDDELSSFCKEMRQLANGFQFSKIVTTLEKNKELINEE